MMFLLGMYLVAPFLSAAGAADNAQIAGIISATKAGGVAHLPEGSFKIGDLTVPEGVSIAGAGCGKTILDATGNAHTLILNGKSAAKVSDLTILNADQAGLLVDGVAGLTLERLVIRHCGCGLIARGAVDGRFQNLVIADNGQGVLLQECRGTALINCTIANSEGLCLSIVGCDQLTVFNNLLTGSPWGIVLEKGNQNLALDYNLYACNFVGRRGDEYRRKRVEDWAALTGHDTHSLTLVVTYRDAAAGDYRPASPLEWAPIRATSSGWGVKELNAIAAPSEDMNGVSRKESQDLGAYQASFSAPRPADGTFKVESGAGITSAGLFTPGGVCVHYLFQNQPLAKGEYSFWFPSHDWQGHPIAAGDYLLKVTEAKLGLDYIAPAGNGDQAMGRDYPGGIEKRVSQNVEMVTFDPTGRIVIAQDGFETGQTVRAYDPAMTHFLWSLQGGGHNTGIAIDDKGRALVMRVNNLLRIDTGAGEYVPFPDGSVAQTYTNGVNASNGMAFLNGKLYCADAKAGKLHILAGENLEPAGEIALTEVSQPSTDPVSGLIWAISGKEIVAIDTSGAVKFRTTPAQAPLLLAASAGYLAVYSDVSHKIDVCDTKEMTLKSVRTIGTGGSPLGSIIPERLWAPRSIAIDKDGNVVEVEAYRTCLFPITGPAKMHLGMWGQYFASGWFANDDRMHYFQTGAPYDIILDPKTRQWLPGTRWGWPDGAIFFCFAAGGKTFGVGPGDKDHPCMNIWLMPPSGVARVVERFGTNKEGLYVQRANSKGEISEADPKQPILDANGKPILDTDVTTFPLFALNENPEGNLVIPRRSQGILFVRMTGLDADGLPQYDFAGRKIVMPTVDGKPDFVSPYDLKSSSRTELNSVPTVRVAPDGSFTAQVLTAGGPPGGEGSKGDSVAGFDSAGKLRWYSPMIPPGLNLGLCGGITQIGGLTVVGRAQNCEFETMDADGLGTGTLAPPCAMGWGGMWLDNNRQMQGFNGNDGKPYLVVGDYAAQSYHWLALTGANAVIHHAQKVTISEQLAQTLSNEQAKPVPRYPSLRPPHLMIKKLATPMPINGDMDKWRGLGIKPILIGMENPTRNSAYVRLAWADDGLYVQVIKFANTISIFQTDPRAHYMQDGIEFNIDTIWDGNKYNITTIKGMGDVVTRDRWIHNTPLDMNTAPRSIKVLDSAADIPERQIFEAQTGCDMSKCKVMVIEFKLSPAALAGLPSNHLDLLASGKWFYLGICINHNPIKGADLFEQLNWPVEYGAFARPEAFAIMTLQ